MQFAQIFSVRIDYAKTPWVVSEEQHQGKILTPYSLYLTPYTFFLHYMIMQLQPLCNTPFFVSKFTPLLKFFLTIFFNLFNF